MVWSEVRNLYLTFSISFLSLLTAIFLNVPETYRVALFTTLSLPILYTTKYYYKHGKYFKRMEDELMTELQVVMASFFAGYIMYVSSTLDFSTSGILIFLFAYAIVNAMKYTLRLFYKAAPSLGINPDNPYVIIGSSFVFSCTFFLIEWILYPLILG